MRAVRLTAFLLLSACSRSAVDGTIGPAGGVREAEGGARLDVPAGALKTEEAIAMSPVTTYPPVPAGTTFKNRVYELTPHGQKFESAVVVRVPASAGEVLLTADLAGAWTVVEGAVFEEGGLVASVRHFSFFAAATTAAGPPSARIFFSDGAALRSIDADGGSLETLVPGSRPSRSITGVAVDPTARTVFWSDDATAKLSRIGYDVSGQATVAQATSGPRAIAVDAVHARVFWPEGATVRSAGLDGGAPSTVATGNAPSSIAVDPGTQRVYWTDGPVLRRADYTGSNLTQLYQGTNGLAPPHALTIDLTNGKLFWAEGPDIRTSGLDGTLVIIAVANPATFVPSALAVDPKRKVLYWTDTGMDGVHSVPYSGSPVRTLFTGGDNPQGLAVDPGK